MNRGAIGCGLLAAAIFVGLGLWGIQRAMAPAACPDRLAYEPSSFEPSGPTLSAPVLDGQQLTEAGTVSFGMAAWRVWVEPGRAPTAGGEPLPEVIVLACGDGYQAYRR